MTSNTEDLAAKGDVTITLHPAKAQAYLAWFEDHENMQDPGWAEDYPEEAAMVRDLQTKLREGLRALANE